MTSDELIAECRRILDRGTKPVLPEVRPLVRAFYALPGNGAGGALHAVLDDGNYERKFIHECIGRASGPGDVAARLLGWVLCLLSNSQRRRV